MTSPAPKTRSGGRRQRRSWWLGLAVAVLLFGTLVPLQQAVDRTREQAQQLRGTDEIMYFPSGNLLRTLAGDFRGALADYAWLRAIQYYAYHLIRDQNYEWLGHIIRIVGQLDPYFTGAYRFGGVVLAWDARQPEEAIRLLKVGIADNQLNWELPFEVAFTHYVRLKQYAEAGYWFRVAARMPDVWSVVPRWAGVAFKKAGSLDMAKEIWLGIWQTAVNPKLRDVARRQLLEVLKEEQNQLQAEVDSLTRERGRPLRGLDELVEVGCREVLPRDPFGRSYRLQGDRVVNGSIELTRQLLRSLQQAADQYRLRRGRRPNDLEELVADGLLSALPEEPLGGTFRIEQGRVETTSELP